MLQTNLPIFSTPNPSSRRRFTDFVFLHDHLDAGCLSRPRTKVGGKTVKKTRPSSSSASILVSGRLARSGLAREFISLGLCCNATARRYTLCGPCVPVCPHSPYACQGGCFLGIRQSMLKKHCTYSEFSPARRSVRNPSIGNFFAYSYI